MGCAGRPLPSAPPALFDARLQDCRKLHYFPPTEARVSACGWPVRGSPAQCRFQELISIAPLTLWATELVALMHFEQILTSSI